jgi:hypothetical protein
MEPDVESWAGARRHERIDGHLTYRNSYPDRTLDSRLGEPHVRLSKLRPGSYFSLSWNRGGCRREVSIRPPRLAAFPSQLPVLWQQFMQPRSRMISDPGEDVGQPSVRIDVN